MTTDDIELSEIDPPEHQLGVDVLGLRKAAMLLLRLRRGVTDENQSENNRA